MSVSIKIRNAVKYYGKRTVISNLSLESKEGEFFTLLGPSGSGKTTLLRMIAGFVPIDGGDFFFNDKRINMLDPSKRNIGMVFQDYAIFPHLSVRENVAFGLKNRKYSREQIELETKKFLQLMHIEQYEDRMPYELSGGEQQRVALARALIIKPDVLLMDEPLSNLDAKLRVEMRVVIREVQKRFGITTVYVTHDQEEAMSISDRIAILYNGTIQQIDTPRSIYQRPANVFVATFVGKANLLESELIFDGKDTTLRLPIGCEIKLNSVKNEYKKNQKVITVIRPADFIISTDSNTKIRAIIDDSMFLGSSTYYFAHFDTGHKVEFVKESEFGKSSLTESDTVYLSVKKKNINVFTEDGNINILKEGDADDKYKTEESV